MTDRTVTVSAGQFITNGKKLFVRARDDDTLMSPGGKLEPDESPFDALARELNEELGVHVTKHDVEYLGEFTSMAFGRHADKKLVMHCYLVRHYSGEIKPQAEISELKWLSATEATAYNIAPVETEFILPTLVDRNLV